MNYPRGKVIGGSSSINAMIYMRGQAADYDHWRQLGLTGWGWNDVLPVFKQHEHHFLGESEHHAVGGEWRIEHPRVRWDLLDAFRAAAEQAGIKRIIDFNTGDNEGSAPYHVNQKFGRRWSTARGFLKPVLHRQNLRLETGCMVERVTFEGKRANGVRFRQNGATKVARCRGEVILSAGSIGSVQTLLLSGVGPAAQLSSLAIPVVLDKPGVGENLQDHLQLRMIYKVTGVKTLNEIYHSLFGRAQILLDYALPPPRTADHGAVAARHLHALRSRARARQHPVSCAAACRSTNSAIRCTPSRPSRRAWPMCSRPAAAMFGSLRRPGGCAGHPAELSGDRRRPSRRRRLDPRRAPDRAAAGVAGLSSPSNICRA